MDFTNVRDIIGGTLKKIKFEFMKGAGPSYRGKTVTDRTKSDLDG